MANGEKSVDTSPSKAKRRCIIWQTENYDDERLLKHLRAVNPREKMPIITELMNKLLSASRQRSVDSVSSKWKHLKASQLKNRDPAPLNAELDEALLSQFDDYVSIITFATREQERKGYSYLSDQLAGMWHQLSRTMDQRGPYPITDRSNALGEWALCVDRGNPAGVGRNGDQGSMWRSLLL